MPTTWEERSLESICTRITDGAHHSPASAPTGKPMASVKDLTPFGIRLESCRLIAQADYDDLVRQGCQPRKGDVLIAKDGATALDTVCEVREDRDLVLLSSVAILRPNVALVDSSYLRYYLDAPATRSYLKGTFISGAAIPRVVLKDLKRAVIRVPPLSVQRMIVEILSAYDNLIENNLRRITILEEMTSTLFQKWFVDFNFPGAKGAVKIASPLGSIPKGWSIRKVSDVACVNQSKITPRTAPEELYYVDISSVSPGVIASPKLYAFVDAPGRARRVVQHGDVLWSCVRPNRRSHAMVLRPQPNTIASTGFAVLTATKVPYTFLYAATTTDQFVAYLTNHATGAAYPAVTARTFEEAEILVPTEPLLKKFAAATIPTTEELSVLHQQSAILRQTRNLLLPRLLSGDIMPADARMLA